MCEECGPCPVFACYTLAFVLTNDGKGTEKTCPRSPKVPGGHDSMCRHGRLCLSEARTYH